MAFPTSDHHDPKNAHVLPWISQESLPADWNQAVGIHLDQQNQNNLQGNTVPMEGRKYCVQPRQRFAEIMLRTSMNIDWRQFCSWRELRKAALLSDGVQEQLRLLSSSMGYKATMAFQATHPQWKTGARTNSDNIESYGSLGLIVSVWLKAFTSTA